MFTKYIMTTLNLLIMNKLEEYRDKEAKLRFANTGYTPVWGYTSGFNAALTLNLPVKFTKWWESEDILNSSRNPGNYTWYKKDGTRQDFASIEDIYKYWIDNVLNLEINQ